MSERSGSGGRGGVEGSLIADTRGLEAKKWNR